MLRPNALLLLPSLFAPIASVRYVTVLKNTIHPAESLEVGHTNFYKVSNPLVDMVGLIWIFSVPQSDRSCLSYFIRGG